MVKRLVGFSEYANALQNFDRLAPMLNPGEREDLDAYIQGRDVFAVETNLSKDLQVANSSLTHPFDADEAKLGLNWMTALARVELASMLAGYTKIRAPFEAVRPTENDSEAYRYLLLDGIRSHYWSLQQDSSLKYLMQSDKIYNLLAYSRRVLIVRSMLGALARSDRDWTFPEQQELSGWISDLDKMHEGMLRYAQPLVNRETSFSDDVKTRHLSRVCGGILNSMERELSAGAATVRTYNPAAGQSFR